jgi:glycosyltransferase involved in cell wall biosynthesis
MRVLHVYKDVYPPVVGGIERHIDSIRRALPDLRHDVLVCSRGPRSRTRTTPTGEEHLVAEFGRVLSTPLAPGFPRRLRRLAPGAVVHLHMPNPVGEISALLRPGDVPMVASYHADVHRQRHLLPVYGPVLARCLRSARVVVAASAGVRDSSPVLRRAAVPVEVVPYAVDVERWARGRLDATEAARLRERAGGPHVVAVGRLVGYKGFDRLVTAARDLPWPVVIVGEGPERPRLERQIAELGLSGRVHLVGAVDDDRLAAHLAAADVFVLPSVNRAEAFGIALLEAQAAGLPVIATDLDTGTAEALEPGVTGLLVAPGDAGRLAAAVGELAADEGRRRAMGEAGRRRVAEHHSLAGLAARLRPIYERALA